MVVSIQAGIFFRFGFTFVFLEQGVSTGGRSMDSSGRRTSAR